MAFIPVSIKGQTIEVDSEAEELTFKELNLKEAHLEEFIRKNIGHLFGDDESLLMVGQQVVDLQGSRSDLVAVDGDGCLVLLEIKRDLLDIKSRSETLESQAIRYAASLAKIRDPRDLVEKMFGSYIAKHRNEDPYKEKLNSLSEYELANRELDAFLKQNEIGTSFNKKQRIILVSSEFDAVTLSSSAWLIRNGVDLSCYELRPLKVNGKHIIEFTKIMPVEKDDDFLVDIHATSHDSVSTYGKVDRVKRRSLPRMAALFDWNILKVGDALEIKNYNDSNAVVVDHKTVEFKGKKISFNDWGQTVTGWSSICIYEWAILKSAGKTLHQIRAEKMRDIEKQAKVA
jgi:hypothetical protein